MKILMTGVMGFVGRNGVKVERVRDHVEDFR
jgi:hypothetical protein